MIKKEIKDTYKKMRVIAIDKTNGSISLRDKAVLFDQNFEISNFTASKEGSENFDKIIKDCCLSNKKNIDLLLLLRCKVSNSMEKWIDKLFGLYEKRGIKLSKEKMYQIVFQDDGERYLRSPETKLEELYDDFLKTDLDTETLDKLYKDNNKIKYQLKIPKRKNFDYILIEELVKGINLNQNKDFLRKNLIVNFDMLILLKEFIKVFKFKYFRFTKYNLKIIREIKRRISPLSAEIIYSFNQFGNAELFTWTKWKVYGDKELKEYCFLKGGRKEFLMSPFSLIGNVSEKNIKKALFNKIGENKAKLDYLDKFLKLYKMHYESYSKFLTDNRVKQNKKAEFLKLLDKNENDLEKIYKYIENLAEAIIEEICKPKANEKSIINNNEKSIIDNKKQEEWIRTKGLVDEIPEILEDDLEEIDIFVNNLFESEFYDHLEKQLKNDMKSWNRQPERKMAWCLFSRADKTIYKGKDFEYILLKINKLFGTDHYLGWLSKIFNFNKLAANAFVSGSKKLRKATFSKDDLDEINPGNKRGNEELQKQLSEIFIVKNLDDFEEDIREFLLDDKKKLLKFQNQFQSIFNPKKRRKEKIIKLVRKLLKKNKINCNL